MGTYYTSFHFEKLDTIAGTVDNTDHYDNTDDDKGINIKESPGTQRQGR